MLALCWLHFFGIAIKINVQVVLVNPKCPLGMSGLHGTFICGTYPTPSPHGTMGQDEQWDIVPNLCVSIFATLQAKSCDLTGRGGGGG